MKHRLFAAAVWLWVAFVRLTKPLLGIRFVVWVVGWCPKEAIAPILRSQGAKIGQRVHFKGQLRIRNAFGDEASTGDFSRLSIGDDVYIGNSVLLDLAAPIRLDDHCLIGDDTHIWTHTDCGYRAMSKLYPRKEAGVHIGYGSWVPPNCMILCGVSLGSMVVVAAGSVVTQSFGDLVLIAGQPAKKMRSIEPVSD